MQIPKKRVIIAILLSFLYPGLGHVYLKAWIRAIAWFLLSLATAMIVVPDSLINAVESGGISILFSQPPELPFEVYASLLAVRFFNILDTYLLASAQTTTLNSSLICTQCGGSLDPDISFCPWCTAIPQ